MIKQRFPIGLEFVLVRPNSRQRRKIVDVHKTYNDAGELVKLRYVTQHEVLGQQVTDHDVVNTTIARGLPSEILSKYN